MHKTYNSSEIQKLTYMSLENFRKEMQELIKNVGSNSNVSFVNGKDEINFLLQYKEFINITRYPYPKFIFDKYDKEKFAKCVGYLNAGHTLLETENYYNSLIPKLVK